MAEFDFEEWARLAREHPDEFERRRRAEVSAAIEAAPEHLRQRLHGLQFRLDLERGRSSTALGSCVRLNSLMWTGFHRLRRELNALANGGGSGADSAPAGTARVIAFPAVSRGSTTGR